MVSKWRKWFLFGCVIGITGGFLLSETSYLPIFFWAISLLSAFMGLLASLKGWRLLCYGHYGVSILTLAFGYMLM